MVNPETFLITTEYVRHALDQLVQVTSDEHVNPLHYLQLIEVHMLTSDYSFFPKPRQFALNDLLITIVQTQYDQQRGLHNLPPVKSGSNLASAIAIIKEDAAIINPDLIGWSWLYFHYVEASLYVSQQKFCEMVNLDERTIRRYQNTTIDQLTKHLIHMEQMARNTRHKQMLCLQLPHQGTVSNLLEREQALDQMRSRKSKHFHITGASGTGKTVFMEIFLQELIFNNQLDQIIWLQSPENIQSVKSYLKESLLIEHSSVTLIEYISLKHVAIVIDDSENLHSDPIELENFLQEFSNAFIFLASGIFYPLPNCFQLNLSELSASAAKTLLSNSNPDYKAYFENLDFNPIWRSIGGNPLAIKLLAQNWSIFDNQTAVLMTLNVLFYRLYTSLKTSERLAWLILALLNSFSTTLLDLSQIDSSYVEINDFITLSRLQIASTTQFKNSGIGLTLSAYQYIQHRYASDPELQKSFDVFVQYMNWTREDASSIRLTLIEALLATDWIRIDSDYFIEAIHQFWKLGVLRGHYTRWDSILRQYSEVLTTENIDFVIGIGICQRYLGQWSQAYSKFMSVIQFAGRHGYFSHQAEAMLELAILFRYQGNYQSVIDTFDHIDTLTRSNISEDIQHRLLIERIELALERNNISEARELLSSFPSNESRKNVFQMDIYARETISLDDINFIVSLSDKLFLDFAHSVSITARIHILMGRIWNKNSDIELAIKHLSIALSLLLEQDNDPFALARAQSNLARLLISKNRLTESSELLQSAKYIQHQIGDRVGLAVTTHNEHVIDRKIVN